MPRVIVCDVNETLLDVGALEPLLALVFRYSTPGTSSRIFSFSILWSSRPIFVSSSSSRPSASGTVTGSQLNFASVARNSCRICRCSTEC